MRASIFGLPPRALWRFYRWRLRRYPVQELFAGSGIAVGVALVFAVQVSNTSITGSADQIVRGITGTAELRVAARSDAGIDAGISARVREQPGVRRAAPLLLKRAAIDGPGGRSTVQLVGVTQGLAAFDGRLTRNFGPGGLRLSSGITLPREVADSIGAKPGTRVTLLSGGVTRPAIVGAVLGEETVGALARSPVAIAQLSVAQRLSGLEGRLSQVLVEAEPGQTAAVTERLRAFAEPSGTVEPISAELRMLNQAAEPNDQSTGIFSAIGAMVGLLLAFTAMLLTVPERRRFVADLRMQGFDVPQVLAVLAFEALLLGAVASGVGIALGDLLSRVVFDEIPEYLTFAFVVGNQRIVEPSTIALAAGGGMLAALVASVLPAIDLFSPRPIDAILRDPGESGEAIRWPSARRLAIIGALLVVLTTLVLALTPDATVVGVGLLAVATLFVLPAFFWMLVRGTARLGRRTRSSMLPLAVMELRATTMRSIALAAVGALAIYGSVAIEGAHRDLLRGLDNSTRERLAAAEIWVRSTSDAVYATESFRPPKDAEALARTPGVASVRFHQGRFVDLGDRRAWVIARPPTSSPLLPSGQVLEGSVGEAARKVSRGGWATVSNTLADSRGVGVGDVLSLPAPTGELTVRIAAITTNMGWPAGAVIVNQADYGRAFADLDPTAIGVELASGISLTEGKRAVAAALGNSPALRVQTRAEWMADTATQSRQGLTRLSQISTLLLLAAALSLAFAMAGTVWQRRPRLAALKIQGFDDRQLWRSLMMETAFLLSVGCAAGAAFGLYGHLLLTRWLEKTTGFPAPFSAAETPAFGALAIVAGIALVVSAVPGYAAVRVSPRAVLQE